MESGLEVKVAADRRTIGRIGRLGHTDLLRVSEKILDLVRGEAKMSLLQCIRDISSTRPSPKIVDSVPNVFSVTDNLQLEGNEAEL